MSEIILSAVSKDVSKFSHVQHKHHSWAESSKMKENSEKWRKFMKEHKGKRRGLGQTMEPGRVDIHLHLEIDKHMVDSFGGNQRSVEILG